MCSTLHKLHTYSSIRCRDQVINTLLRYTNIIIILDQDKKAHLQQKVEYTLWQQRIRYLPSARKLMRKSQKQFSLSSNDMAPLFLQAHLYAPLA